MAKAPSLTLARGHPPAPVPPPAPPPILKTRSQHISNHTLHLPPTHHTLAPLNDPRRARVARKAHALSRSFTRRHASNPSLQFTCGNAPTVFYASSAIPVSTPQPQISRFWVCRYFNSISAFCFVRARSSGSMYIRLHIMNIVLSFLNTFEPPYWLLAGSSEQNQTYSLIRKE